MSKSSGSLRLLAARVINDVTEGHSLSDCLNEALLTVPDARDRGFIRAVCYGVCRFYTRLDVLLSYLLKKPMKAKDSDVHALILVGLYQLMDMRVPEHAAVDETVNAAEKLHKPWAARGFVNAILREYLRERTTLDEKLKTDPEALYAHPVWWIDYLKAAWPQQWKAILEANNAHPPFSLRVNKQRIARDAYLQLLREHELPARPLEFTSEGVVLETAVAVESLPGFDAGDVFVQDGAPQLAASLISLAPGQRVLDACAAPGGKLTHLLESEPQLGEVVAVEHDAKRMQSIRDNLTRLGMSDRATLVCADAADTGKWWDKQAFDRILLDAPCSASGVIRRHPDIKLLKQPDDLDAFAAEQLHLLSALWPLLKPGGLLLYATCSVFPEENSKLIQCFLAAQSDAKEEKIDAAWGVPCEAGRQILPGMHEMDGFYYARLRKGISR